jgi:hypothetical protein
MASPGRRTTIAATPGTPVRIASVAIDPPFVRRPERVRYRVTLRCGCRWWEDRSQSAAPPFVGTIKYCYASHSQDSQRPPAEPALPAAGAGR